MDAHRLMNALLENEVDDEIDPLSYALGTGEKETWIVPHPWVAVLRPLGYKIADTRYNDEEGKPIQYYGMEKDIKLASGEKLELTVSGYTHPELQGKVGVSIAYDEYPGSGRGPAGFFGSRPIALGELKRVMRDIERRIRRTHLEYSWGNRFHEMRAALEKLLRPYEYWHAERKKPKV